MKILVDRLPNTPSECLFSEIKQNVSPVVHKCKLDDQLCAYYLAGWDKVCPHLISLEDKNTNRSESSPSIQHTESDEEYEEQMRGINTPKLLSMLPAVGGNTYDIIKKILEERGAI